MNNFNQKIKNALATPTGKGVFGTFVGMLNGVFGAGGGSLLVPTFTLEGMEQKTAQATALCLTLPMTLVTVGGYTLMDGIPSGALWAAVGATAGGILGGMLLNNVQGIWLSRLFYALMLVGGASMIL